MKLIFNWAIILVMGSTAIAMDAHSPIVRELNPAKGITVWREPQKEVVISWPSYHDFSVFKRVTFMMDEGSKITLSPFSWVGDFAPLVCQMIRYDFSNLDPTYNQKQNFKFAAKNLQGYIIGESVLIENLSMKNFGGDIQCLEKEFYQKGARRVYIPLINTKNEIGHRYPINYGNHETTQQLQKEGYADISKCCNLMTSASVNIFMKELSFEESSGINCENPKNILNIEWTQKEETSNFPPLSDQFGIFIRNKNGQTKGCVWGRIEAEAAHPHAYINLFFMDESVRGTGLGKRAMEYAEHYIKSRKIKLIALGTSDHQAPWFYEKIGYVRECTLPKFLKGRNGEYINCYHYLKTLGLDMCGMAYVSEIVEKTTPSENK